MTFFLHWREQKQTFPASVCLFVLLDLWEKQNPESLGQVVEAHRHTDVAGKTDVDAEVDQPLFAWAWDRTTQ